MRVVLGNPVGANEAHWRTVDQQHGNRQIRDTGRIRARDLAVEKLLKGEVDAAILIDGRHSNPSSERSTAARVCWTLTARKSIVSGRTIHFSENADSRGTYPGQDVPCIRSESILRGGLRADLDNSWCTS